MSSAKSRFVSLLFALPLVGLATASAEDGVSFISPGKIDFTYKHFPDDNRHNGIWWTPFMKAGAGYIDLDDGEDIDFAGGYFRPLLARPDLGELILGANTVARGSRRDFEYQGEYRFPSGLGFGGGHVDRDGPAPEITFGKVTWRNKIGAWNHILAAQVQDVSGRGDTSPGGYAALYNDQWMFVGGADGEQWRTTLGWVSPKSDADPFRPAFEALYVDSSVGDFPGPKFLFVNASLGFKGGFLSHPARLGRAMGPQGLEYGNPLGFLRPTWNRRLDVWELGGLANFRLVHTDAPNVDADSKYEALAYPFQFDGNANPLLDAIFVGGFYHDAVADETAGVLGGISGKFGKASVSVGLEYNADREETSATVGLIGWF